MHQTSHYWWCLRDLRSKHMKLIIFSLFRCASISMVGWLIVSVPVLKLLIKSPLSPLSPLSPPNIVAHPRASGACSGTSWIPFLCLVLSITGKTDKRSRFGVCVLQNVYTWSKEVFPDVHKTPQISFAATILAKQRLVFCRLSCIHSIGIFRKDILLAKYI